MNKITKMYNILLLINVKNLIKVEIKIFEFADREFELFML